MKLTSKSMTIYDTTSTSFDLRRMPRFRNTSKLSKNVAVTYTVDIRARVLHRKIGQEAHCHEHFAICHWQCRQCDEMGRLDERSGCRRMGCPRRMGSCSSRDTLSQMYDDGTHVIREG